MDSGDTLTNFGKSLLTLHPDDYDVMFHTVETMDVNTAERRAEVLKYLRTLINSDPKRAVYHGMAGAMHLGIFGNTHDEIEREVAKEEYQKAYDLTPLDNWGRNVYRLLVQSLSK